MSQDKRIETIERGKEASLVEAAISDRLDEQKDRIIRGMISHYRAATLDSNYLFGRVGELCALFDLEAALESEQRRAYTAAEQEMSNAKA